MKTGCSFFLDHKKEIEAVANMKFVYSEWYIRKKIIEAYEFKIHKITETKCGGGFTPLLKTLKI